MGERVALHGSTIRPVQGVTGSCVASAGTLYANGKKVVLLNDDVNENKGTGKVTEGNNDGVYFNGVSISRRGSWTKTSFNNYKSIIQDAVSSNVYIGYLRDGGLDDLSGKVDEIDGQKPPYPDDVAVGDGTSYEVQTRSWRDKRDWGWRDANDGGVPEEQYYVYQGEWTDTEPWGNHKGLIMFPQYLRDYCKDQVIKKIEIYLVRNDTQGYYYEQPLYVYTHNYTTLFPEPDTGNTNNEPDISNYGGAMYANDGLGWAINDAKWCTLPTSYNQLLSNGSMTGIAFYRSQRDHYMHFDGKKVKVKVSFGE